MFQPSNQVRRQNNLLGAGIGAHNNSNHHAHHPASNNRLNFNKSSVTNKDGLSYSKLDPKAMMMMDEMENSDTSLWLNEELVGHEAALFAAAKNEKRLR